MRKSDKRLAYLLVFPIVAILIVLIFVPIAVTFYYSLCDYKLTSRKGIQFAGLKNYLDVLADETTQVALVNSGIIFVIVLAITVVLGMIFALALTKRTKISGFLLALVVVPWALPPIVNGIIWRFMFHPSFGLINSILLHLNAISEPIQWFNERTLLLVVISVSVAWRAIPLAALVFFSALQSVPTHLYEVAKIDGCSSSRAFFSITLPLISPTMSVVLTTTTITGLSVFDEVVTLVGNSSNYATVMMESYLRSFKFLNFGNGSAFVYIVMIIEILFVILFMKVLRKDVEYL